LFFCQRFLGEKQSVKRFVVVMQQPVLLSPKLGAKSSNVFTQSPKNATIACGIDCLALQDEVFVNYHLDVEERDEHALKFALGEFELFHWEDCCFVSGS
jgi:tRNA U34 2-thiouridine synthase MnmA/TrmU